MGWVFLVGGLRPWRATRFVAGLTRGRNLSKRRIMRLEFLTSVSCKLARVAWLFVALAQGCATRSELSARVRPGIPEWAQGNTVERTGQLLKVVCSGQGPSIDHARKYALGNCKSGAIDFLRSDVSVRGVTVESETGVAVHQEIQQNAFYRGLACKPLRDEVRPADGGLFEVWLKCEFDLSKVQQATSPDEDSAPASTNGNGGVPLADREGLVRQREMRWDGQTKNPSTGTSTTVIDIVSIPPCESLVVKGRNARPVKCSADGVTSVTIGPGDEEIIVRASGWLSKTVKVAPGAPRHETVQVILDPVN